MKIPMQVGGVETLAFTPATGITNFNNRTRVVKNGNTVTAVISIKTSSAVTSTAVDVFTLDDTRFAPSDTVYASGYTSGGLVSFAMTNAGKLVIATVYGSHSGASGIFGEITWTVGS